MRAALLLVASLLAGPAKADPIAAIEGVYKDRHPIEVVTEPGRANALQDTEDIVEIVRHDDTHVYFRARLWFHNGHVCAISGIAGVENGAYVYRDPELVGGKRCTLRIATVSDQLMLSDRVDGEATCSVSHCGVNGSLGSYAIPLAKRRPIRYLDRIKSSRQYLKAIHDLQQSNLQRADPGATVDEVQRRHQE